jgi:general secretion pathway protein E
MELGIPAYLIRATLIGVLAQRLLRTLCPHCKLPLELTPARWQELADMPPPALPLCAHQAVGCLECRETGFLGRTGIYEVLQLTPKLRERITRETELDGFRRAARAQGLQPLRTSGALKVAQGLTTIEEVLSLTPDPNAAT